MKIRTMEEIYERMSRQSKLLHPELHQGKGNIWMMDTSKAGLQRLLAERNDPEDGFLFWARKEVAVKLGEWQFFKNSCIVKPKDPVGQFEENINRARAKVKLLEAECRWLNNKIREIEKEEEESTKKAVVNAKMRGGIKNRDGSPFSCDGRLLAKNDEDEIVFKDEPKLSLVEYLEQVKKDRLAKSKIKRAKHNAEVLESVKKRLGEPSVVEKKPRKRLSNA